MAVGLIVRGVIGEDGGAVEGTVILGKIELEVVRNKDGTVLPLQRLTQHLSPMRSGRSPRMPTPITWVEE